MALWVKVVDNHKIEDLVPELTGKQYYCVSALISMIIGIPIKLFIPIEGQWKDCSIEDTVSQWCTCRDRNVM